MSALAAAAAPAVVSQAPAPEFGAGVELVTVDAVVLDSAGRTVPGLTRDDFDVREEGQPQSIASFEAVRVLASPETPQTLVLEGVATNASSPVEPRRVFVVAFDDAHLSAVTAGAARRAVQQFLTDSARAGDLVWLTPISGGAGYQAVLPEGRAELLAALDKLQGRRMADSSTGRVSDYEAMRIVQRDEQVMAQVRKRLLDLETVNDPREQFSPSGRDEAAGDRRAALKAGSPELLTGRITAQAAQVYSEAVAQRSATFEGLAAALRALQAQRGRKAVLLLSEGFIDEPAADKRKELIDAARRANAAIYFVDARGLAGGAWTADADVRAASDVRDAGAVADDPRRGSAGADSLALDSGGFSLRNTNDLAGSLERVARESESYYLIGYQPKSDALDGKFRRIQVTVKREGLEVRARKGYFAPDPRTSAPAASERLRAAAESPLDAGGIPLRLSTYVTGAAPGGKSSVLLAAEADASGLGPALETLAVVTRAGAEPVRRERTFKVQPDRADPFGAPTTALPCSFELAPGSYDARLVVRDAASGRLGSVRQRFDVPEPNTLHVSTPILTDTLEEGLGGQSPVVLARRHFAPGARMFGLFEVLGATQAAGGPRVAVGYGVRAADGHMLGNRPLTPLPAGPAGDLTQTLVVPLDKLQTGRYELVLQVRDDLSGQTLERSVPFIVGDPGAAGAAAAAMRAAAAASAAGRDAAGYLALVERYRGGAPGAPEALAAWSPREMKPGVEQAKSGKDCDDACRRGAALLHLEAAVDADLRGQAQSAAAHVAAGRELLDKARGDEGFRAQWLLAVGYHLLGLARFAEAEPILEEAAKTGSAEALVGLGAIWDLRAAIETLAPGAAREAAPIGSQALTQFQIVAQRERSVRKAEDEYRRALKLRPDLAEAHLRLGRVLSRRDKPDEARAELEAAAAGGDSPVKLLAHLFLGDLDEGQARYADAVAHYRAALAAEPSSQAARLALSYALLRAGDRRAAAQSVREVAGAGGGSGPPDTQAGPGDGWLAYRLGPSRHLDEVTRALRAKVRS